MLSLLSFPSSKVVMVPGKSGGNFRRSGACPLAHYRVKLAPAMPDATIHAVGEILENLNPILYRVALPNGKLILAHLSKALTEAGTVFPVAERVVLELTAYDFDQARILGRAE